MPRYVRYQLEDRVRYGRLEDEVIAELDGDDLFAGLRETGRTVPLARARLLPPCRPSKLIAIGLNYRSHLGDRPAPRRPGMFAKLPSAVIGPDDAIVIPDDAAEVHYEGELVVVIGKRAKNVPEEAAAGHVFGVTAGNDVSERTWQRDDLQWLRAKGSDSFAPLGPAIATDLDYRDLRVETRLNGEPRQSARTGELIFGVDRLVSYISRYITLLPGDVVFTGTPGSTGRLSPGDVVEVEVEEVGVLRNRVAAAGG